tara:strand:+ start:536 stop:976 length:441 start_codon:yes stop_codon:yes gene_type:complete
MVYAISTIIIILSIVYILKKFKKNSQRLFFLLSIVVIFLVLTGRAHWISAIVVALIPVVKKLFLILRYLPILQRFNSFYRQKKNSNFKQSMSKEEAANILNIDVSASEDEIILAHKKAMQKNHPDKGGSKEIASKINSAKKTLLEK